MGRHKGSKNKSLEELRARLQKETVVPVIPNFIASVEQLEDKWEDPEGYTVRDRFINNLEETYKECVATVKKKNADYAEEGNPFANFENSVAVGVPLERGILIRVMDKISRVSNLLDREAKVKDESITDSLLDSINYLAILKAYIDMKGDEAL